MTGIVPAIVQTPYATVMASPFTVTREGVAKPTGTLPQSLSSALTAAEQAAKATAHLLFTMYDELPNPPELPKGRRWTTFGLRQHWQKIQGDWGDKSTLVFAVHMTNGTSLGPLPHAVQRAIDRHKQRKEPCWQKPCILEIGAGERLVPWGLKAMFGDAVWIEESSPAYGSLKGAIDRELPLSGIDDAELKPSTYELAYSLHGSIYGKNQLHILQKMVDGLKVGGELFVNWGVDDKHAELWRLVNHWPAVFSHGGIDLTVEYRKHRKSQRYAGAYAIWGRKRDEHVNIRELFEVAANLDRNYRYVPFESIPRVTLSGREAKAFDVTPSVRLTTTTPAFPYWWFDRRGVTYLTRNILAAARKGMGVGFEEFDAKIREARDLPTSSSRDPTMRLQEIAYSMVTPDALLRLEGGIPLTSIVMDQLAYAIFEPEEVVVVPT